MEGDRAAVLIVGAAVDGLVDFREAQVLDPQWWKRLRVLCDALERKSRYSILDASYRYRLALVANSGLSADSFTAWQDKAKETYLDMIGCLRSWETKGYLDTQRRVFRDARQQYIDAFGVDPMDEQFRAYEERQIELDRTGAFDKPADPLASEMDARFRQRDQRQAEAERAAASRRPVGYVSRRR